MNTFNDNLQLFVNDLCICMMIMIMYMYIMLRNMQNYYSLQLNWFTKDF